MNYQIKDSYKIRSYGDIHRTLDKLQHTRPVPAAIYFRSLQSLEREWYAHNLLYDLHLFRSHTKDVDFEYPQKWYYATIWAILSIFYRP